MARLVLTVFAAIAVLLASIGLFGLVSHGVTERRHEIGVRLALGAERRDVLRLVLAGGVLMTLAGISLGLAGAAVVSRALEELLFGVKPLDGPTFAATPALLLAVSLVACAVPAWRATRIAPATALRAE
jgi:putative ABC transport system permease protein